jgi:hypothetical protein
MKAHHRAKMISVPVRVITCFLVHDSNALLHDSVVGAQRLFSSIVSVKNEIPAGAKPSGLPASVQEARVKV